MRRPIMVVLVAIAASISLVSGATAAPKANVTDQTAKGETIAVLASDCKSGPGYTAFVDVRIVRAEGTVLHEQTYPTPSGEINILMTEIGSFLVYVTCRHDFEGGGSDTYYEENEFTQVTGLTAEERQKCKKKKTAKKRRNCKKREKAD